MYRNSSTKIFPIILIIIVVVALIIGIVSVANYLFGGGGEEASQQKTQAELATEKLLRVDVDQSVRVTVRGPIVANEEFRTRQIIVSPTQREYIVYKGYLESIESRKTYSNNTKAYDEFVHALDKAALTKSGKYTTEEQDDLRGICASGLVYQFDILSGGSADVAYWTSTCKGSPGTFGASLQQVTNLFANQIPDKVDLGTQSTLPTLR